MAARLLLLSLCSLLLNTGAETCNFNVTDWEGQFSSPDYGFYSPNLDCYWLFPVAEGNLVQIDFIDFSMEQSDDCTNDYVEFLDVSHGSTKVITRLCGENTGTTVLSNGNTLLMHMHTDDANQDRGFIVDHKGICIITFTTESGTIASPNFPSKYPGNLDCVWLIDLGPGYNVTLTFHTIVLENNEDCSYDRLTVQEGNTEDAPLKAKRCSNDSLTDVTTSGPMRILFHTDGDNEFEGFYLTYTTKDQDECLRPEICHSNATCANTVGSYQCTCLLSYTGDGKSCQWYRDFDECDMDVDDCHVDAHCINTLTYFECHCKDGFLGDGNNCTDIIECETTELAHKHNCHQNASCANTHGSFRCTCISVYTGDGVTCQDTNGCEINTHNCHVDGTCINTDGSFQCECKVGYAGSGIMCSDIEECSDNINNCHSDATCANTKGSFDCTCFDGYNGDGVTCTDVDECSDGLHDCHADGYCNNTKGAYYCTCNVGYYGNGVNCTDTTEEDHPSSRAKLVVSASGGVVAIAIICVIVLIVLRKRQQQNITVIEPTASKMGLENPGCEARDINKKI